MLALGAIGLTPTIRWGNAGVTGKFVTPGRTANCIAGPGRWDADSIANELECSRRAVHRLLQTLSMADAHWYVDETTNAYKLRSGFRMAQLAKPDETADSDQQPQTLEHATQVLQQAELIVEQLRQFCDRLKS